jgi:hypothetical protein
MWPKIKQSKWLSKTGIIHYHKKSKIQRHESGSLSGAGRNLECPVCYEKVKYCHCGNFPK